MKRLLLIIGCVFIATQLMAQPEEEEIPGGKDRLVMEINWNGWLDAPDSIKTKWFSRGINFYVMFDMPLGNSRFSVAPGAGLGIDNVYHEGMFVATDTMGTQFLPIPDSINFKKNKLNTVYLDIPLELRFRTKPNEKNKSFKIAVGVKGGLLLANKVKYVGEGTTFGLPQQEVKYKQFKVPNIDNLRYGLTFRVGYGPINAQVFYGLSTLFETGLGPQMAPLNIGVSFNGL